MPGPGSSGSWITAAPTLCSAMNAAASRNVRPGVIVNTLSDMASRTFTATPLRCGSLPCAKRYLPRRLSCWRGCGRSASRSAQARRSRRSRAPPYELWARLRRHEPVSWLPAIEGWLVTRRDLALAAMRDAAAFTVQDPRFTTARVVGPSMLSLDGPEHDRHRAPFVEPLRLGAVRATLAEAVREEAVRLLDRLEPVGEAELRRGFAGPVAAAVVTRSLGLSHADVDAVLGHYDAIVGAVSDLSAGRPARPEAAEAMASLAESLRAGGLRFTGGLEAHEYVSNAAVMLFGGIETTEGMIANAVAHLLADADELARAREDADPPARLAAVVEESLRLEPAAAAIDRYATADTRLGGAELAAGDLVRISITAANRDPATFPQPDRFDPDRP